MAARLPSEPAMAVLRSCEMTPISSRAEEILNEVFTLASSAITSERVNGRSVGPTREEAVPEGVNFIAVDRGDGAVGADAHIARHQFDADHRARAAASRDRPCGLPARRRWKFPGVVRGRACAVPERTVPRAARAESAERKRRRDFSHASIAETGRSRGKAARRRSAAGWQSRRAGAARPAPYPPQHLLDRTDARDRILGVRECHGDRADQLAIDIYRTAAHALHHAGVFERSAGEPRQNQRFLGACVFQDAQNLDVEILDFVAAENGLAGAAHACLDVLEGHDDRAACAAARLKSAIGKARRVTVAVYSYQRNPALELRSTKTFAGSRTRMVGE